ncbi:MAG: hypothetical protein IPK26_06045 [Planctomycetes bacterium]|nr:hypothetical protein [Planctomycetota bacterium]
MNAPATLPPGTLFTVFGPLLAMALLFVTLMWTPDGGPVGGDRGIWCVGAAVLLAVWTVRWLLRLPRPIGVLRWCAALPALLLALLLVSVSIVTGVR